MAKAIFRWLRGELNGFYITRLHNTLNMSTEDIKEFLIAFNQQQFEHGQITDETLYNLGKFAGVFLPRITSQESRTAVHMTSSHEVNGTEYSERGLYLPSEENFNFYHTDGEEEPDINTLATENERSTLVGDETPIGYISESETDLFDDYGRVKLDKVLSEPPQDEAYTEYYGEKFLYLSEGAVNTEALEPSLFMELFKALQKVRYNGASLKSLVDIIAILCPDGLVKIAGIEESTLYPALNVYYVYDAEVDIPFKTQRVFMLDFIVKEKFKQVVLIENS